MGDFAWNVGLPVAAVVLVSVGLAVTIQAALGEASGVRPVCEDTWYTKDHIKVTCENGSHLLVLPSGDLVCRCPGADGGSDG